MIVQLYCSVHETRPLLPTPHMERRVPASSVEGQSTTTTTRLVSMSSQTTATQHIFVSWFIKWKFVVFLFFWFFFYHCWTCWQRPIWQRNIFSGLLLPTWAAILTKFCVGEKKGVLNPHWPASIMENRCLSALFKLSGTDHWEESGQTHTTMSWNKTHLDCTTKVHVTFIVVLMQIRGYQGTILAWLISRIGFPRGNSAKSWKNASLYFEYFNIKDVLSNWSVNSTYKLQDKAAQNVVET